MGRGAARVVGLMADSKLPQGYGMRWTRHGSLFLLGAWQRCRPSD
jgi:hypothetical protein